MNNEKIIEELRKARAIMSRLDYSELPADVKAWCEALVKSYGHLEEANHAHLTR
jgi:hypothetical protein